MTDQATPAVVVEHVGPESAAEVLAVIRDAFADRPPLDPPTDALSETEETIAARLGYSQAGAQQQPAPPAQPTPAG